MRSNKEFQIFMRRDKGGHLSVKDGKMTIDTLDNIEVLADTNADDIEVSDIKLIEVTGMTMKLKGKTTSEVTIDLFRMKEGIILDIGEYKGIKVTNPKFKWVGESSPLFDFLAKNMYDNIAFCTRGNRVILVSDTEGLTLEVSENLNKVCYGKFLVLQDDNGDFSLVTFQRKDRELTIPIANNREAWKAFGFLFKELQIKE